MFLTGNGRRVEKANPYHDPKTGRFASAPASSSASRKKPKGKDALGESEGYTMIARKKSVEGRTMEIWRSNEPHGSQIIFEHKDDQPFTDAQKAKVMQSMNECQSVAQIRGAEIVVSERSFEALQLHDSSNGFVIGAGTRQSKDVQDVIHVHPRVLRDGRVLDEARRTGFIVNDAASDPTRYVVAHEYGHLVHNVRHRGMMETGGAGRLYGDDDLEVLGNYMTWMRPDGNLGGNMALAFDATSIYGRSEPVELYAETFSRFVHQTTTRSPYTPDVQVFMGDGMRVFGNWSVGMDLGSVPRRTDSTSMEDTLSSEMMDLIYWGSAIS